MHLSGRYACYQVYPTKDGRYMSLGALEPKFWKNFCEALGKKDLIPKQFIEGEDRIRIIEEIKTLFITKTQNEWADFFKEVDACCEPILALNEVFQHPHVLHRKMLIEYEHPVEGKVRQVGNPIKSSNFPFKSPTPSPQWGEHTHEVLREAGYSEEDIKHFKDVGII
jgi:crotonobetainyl-CoA:carnitine CoA-transferase CaiB-like acyl-CoA transferase